MPIFSQPGERKPVVVDGDTYYKTDLLEAGRDRALSPTVFLVEQAPRVSLRTHFHRHNQFQLFVRGGGTIGPHALSALTVHYAGGYTGYGPLVAGDDGLAYMTLRSVYETGSLTMKEHAAMMKRGPKRQMHSIPVQIASSAELAAIKSATQLELIELEPDGLAACLLTVPADRQIDPQLDPAGSVGRFHVILAGALNLNSRHMAPGEIAFVAAGEQVEMVAPGGGAQIACLQIPPEASEYRD